MPPRRRRSLRAVFADAAAAAADAARCRSPDAGCWLVRRRATPVSRRHYATGQLSPLFRHFFASHFFHFVSLLARLSSLSRPLPLSLSPLLLIFRFYCRFHFFAFDFSDAEPPDFLRRFAAADGFRRR